MLTTIHEKTQGWITAVILGLLTIPFALWGVNSYFEHTGVSRVATINGQGISVAVYRSELEHDRAAVEAQMGRSFDPRILETTKFKQRVLDGLIDRTLLDHATASLGYRIAATDLAEYIRHAPQFRKDGKFDPTLYASFVQSTGYGVQQFEARVRQQRINQQMEAGLVASTIVTEDDLADVVRLLGEKRTVSYTVIPPQKFISASAVTPAQIQAYYASHQNQFSIPEQVRVQYIELSASDLEKTLNPTEQELQQTYARNISRYTTPEARRASHILIALAPDAPPQAVQKALAEAQSIRARLLHGASFAALARKYSADPVSAAKGGDLGYVVPGSLEKTLVSALYALKKPGDISEPVRTRFGFHIIKLTAIRPAVTIPFAQVRTRVAADWRKRHAIDRYYGESEHFRNLIFEQSDSLDPAAKSFGLKVAESGWFSRAGGPGVAANPKVVAAAFDPDVLVQGHNSHAIRIGSHALLAIRDVAHRAAAVKPLAEVSGEIRQRLAMRAARARAGKEGAALLASLQKGATLDAQAKRSGLEVKGPVTVTRNDPAGLPPALVEAVFQAGQPAASRTVFGGADLGVGGYAVFALTRVMPGSLKDSGTDVEHEAARILAQRRGSDYFADFLAGLRQKAKIRIYRKNL